MENSLTVFSNDDLVDNIIVWLCDQEMRKPQIKALLAQYRPSIADEESEQLIDQAFEKIATIHQEQYSPVEVIHDHVAKYEHIYNYFTSINHATGANKALQAKERLLGILKESNSISITKKETKKYYHTPPEYDISQLTPAEQERLNYLQSKCIGT